ncbi:LysE family translocator [Rhodospirillum sp. A1_3_36]|uniref:LysE family translocator n=1 Tax=Rhodospirillum sp. A1_3_36 TaxID=3391666 RepID=UPI0039A45661
MVGFAIAAPVGPVGILCIRKALADGRIAAFVAGLGAAFADTFYGAVAGLGLSLVSDFLFAHRIMLSVVGGVFLVILGMKTLRKPPLILPTGSSRVGLFKDFLSSFTITLTNPGTIIAFMAVFASFSVVSFERDALDASLIILGVFVGSSLWWATLACAAGAVRSHFTPVWLLWLNRISGVALLVFGLAVLAGIFFF